MGANMPQHPKTLRCQLASLVALAAASPLAIAQQDETLKPVVISAERSQETNYTIPAIISATGLDLSLRETPQSISVITQKRMEEQQLNSVSDAITPPASTSRNTATAPTATTTTSRAATR